MGKVLFVMASRRVTDDEASEMTSRLREVIPESVRIALLEGVQSVQLVDIPDAAPLPALLPVDPE